MEEEDFKHSDCRSSSFTIGVAKEKITGDSAAIVLILLRIYRCHNEYKIAIRTRGERERQRRICRSN
jgi:hypothetical protein